MRRITILLWIAIVLTGAWRLHGIFGQGQMTGTRSISVVNGAYPSDQGRSWSAYGTKTDTSNLQLQAAPGAGQSVFLYEAYCVNVHATTAGVALIKYSTTTVASVTCTPASGMVTPTFFDPPLQFPANTAITMNSPAGITTLHFFASGTIAR